MNFEKQIQKVPHLFTENHAHVIYGLVRWLRPTNCLEIGCFAGFVSCWIAKALEDNGDKGDLYVVDNWSLGTTSEQLHNNLSYFGLANRVGIHSPETVPVNIGFDFAFIDGNHSLEGLKRDFTFAAERGAICIVVHDTVSWWGPKEFLADESLYSEFTQISVPFDQGLAIFMRKYPEQPLRYTEKEYPKGEINSE